LRTKEYNKLKKCSDKKRAVRLEGNYSKNSIFRTPFTTSRKHAHIKQQIKHSRLPGFYTHKFLSKPSNRVQARRKNKDMTK